MSDIENSNADEVSVMHVLGALRPLVLAAHAAARAMCRLTLKPMLKRLLPQRTLLPSACRRLAWTPLLLRWACKARAAWSRGAVRAPALPAWPTPQFHWHFHLAALSGSDRERREARTMTVTSLNSSSADRMAGTGYRRLGGPTGTIAEARSIPAYPQYASIGRVRLSAATQGAETDLWKASPTLENGRTSYMYRWFERAVAHTRRLHGKADRHLAVLPHAPAAHSFLVRGPRQPGSFDRTRITGRNASGYTMLTSTSVAPRSPTAAPAVMNSPRRSIYAQVQAGSGDFLRQTRSLATRTLLWPKREHPASPEFDSSHPPGVGRRPSEQAWHARTPVATATQSSRHTAAPGVVSSIAMRRPVDLVWLASPTSSASLGDTPRFGTTSAAGAPAARPIQPIADVPTVSSRTSDKTVVRATELAPLLANRLADEVIRRIDHRARIERERRGL